MPPAPPKAKKVRLDLLLVASGLVESREKAQRLVLAGEVLVNDAPATKPGHLVPSDAALRIRHPEPFVSRGGLKLQEAFDRFPFRVDGARCIDVGASTGGFTDCLLQHGAESVIAVDVGRSLLHPRIASDPRVTVLDSTNARYLAPDALPPGPLPTVAVTDVSFISLKLILPAIDRVLQSGGQIVALVKPQFEAGRAEVGKGGVVRDPAVRRRILSDILDFASTTLGWTVLDSCPSPIKGPAGNVEYLAWFQKKDIP